MANYNAVNMRNARADWFWWEVLFPLVFLLFLYVIARWFIQVTEPFSSAFSDGHLLLYSALLLVGVSVELRKLQYTDGKLRDDKGLRNAHNAALLLGVLSLVTFMVVRTQTMRSETLTDQSGLWRIRLYGISGFVAAFGAISLGFFTLNQVIAKVLEAQHVLELQKAAKLANKKKTETS